MVEGLHGADRRGSGEAAEPRPLTIQEVRFFAIKDILSQFALCFPRLSQALCSTSGSALAASS